MTGREYVEIFKTENLPRTATVKLLEEQIRSMQDLAEKYKQEGEFEKVNLCLDEAEKAKWEAIGMAEYEKEYGVIEFDRT